MICVSEGSAADALLPGVRLPRSRVLPSPDATGTDDARSPMMIADASTTEPLLRNSLRNMGGSLPVGFPFPCQLGSPSKVAVGCPPGATLQRVVRLNGQRVNAKIGHAPGTPRSSWAPRISNA